MGRVRLGGGGFASEGGLGGVGLGGVGLGGGGLGGGGLGGGLSKGGGGGHGGGGNARCQKHQTAKHVRQNDRVNLSKRVLPSRGDGGGSSRGSIDQRVDGGGTGSGGLGSELRHGSLLGSSEVLSSLKVMSHKRLLHLLHSTQVLNEVPGKSRLELEVIGGGGREKIGFDLLLVLEGVDNRQSVVDIEFIQREAASHALNLELEECFTVCLVSRITAILRDRLGKLGDGQEAVAQVRGEGLVSKVSSSGVEGCLLTKKGLVGVLEDIELVGEELLQSLDEGSRGFLVLGEQLRIIA